MTLKKSKDALIAGIIILVKASISLESSSTAAEISLFGSRIERISESSKGYASIFQAFLEFGIYL